MSSLSVGRYRHETDIASVSQADLRASAVQKSTCIVADQWQRAEVLSIQVQQVDWLVILDISLPEMDGYEVLRRMRLIDPNIPVIAFTAHAGRDYRERAMQAGFTDIVTKPVRDMDAFCRRIIEAADRGAA
jgi:CheY-like chemotaxis protein